VIDVVLKLWNTGHESVIAYLLFYVFDFMYLTISLFSIFCFILLYVIVCLFLIFDKTLSK
jgi:hypothetical protein